MSKLKFTPEMFNYCSGLTLEHANKKAADICNEAFDKWLSEQIIIKTWSSSVDSQWYIGERFMQKHPFTHQARLVDIQPIDNKECEHKVMINIISSINGIFGTCRECGENTKLTQQWKVAK